MDNFHLCPKFETAFELLGKRWTGLIIRSLQDGAKRYKDISQIIPGMSDRMITERFNERYKLFFAKKWSNSKINSFEIY